MSRRKLKQQELTVVVFNSSGRKTTYPDGRVEGHVVVSAEREQIACEAINRCRREALINARA